MAKYEEILKEGSKAFKLIQQLKKHAEVCFTEGDFKYDAVKHEIMALENQFRPFANELKRREEEKRLQQHQLEQICSKEGHVGEWIEDRYNIRSMVGDLGYGKWADIPKVRWIRTCTRCGKQEVSDTEPEEVKKLKKLQKIEQLEKEIMEIKADL